MEIIIKVRQHLKLPPLSGSGQFCLSSHQVARFNEANSDPKEITQIFLEGESPTLSSLLFYSFKACFCYFFNKFLFFTKLQPFKNYEMFFISCKKLFSFSRYSIFCISIFPSFSPCQPLLQSLIQDKLKFMTSSTVIIIIIIRYFESGLSKIFK